MRQLVPIFDHAIATLIEDLEERGLINDVTVLGVNLENSKVNTNGGRDHWPKLQWQ